MNDLHSLRATGWSYILFTFGTPADKKKFSARLLTAMTVLFLIFAGSPLADINTNIASADSNPYATAGTIVVNTNNEAATFTLTGPTTYTGNGTSWTQTNASVGDHTITYGAIPEFDTPASEIQALVSGGTITFSGTYLASVGTISVTTNKAGATFTLTGSANYTGNGTNWTQNNAPAGTYTITFDPIPGYDTPSSHDHTLESGGTITCTGLYNVSAGTISVTTNNDAATFTLTGPATYTGSGTSWTQTDAPAGDYTIAYGSIPGYDTPASETLTLSSGGTITFTGTYTASASVGTITVTTNNAAATFTVTGTYTGSGSGTSWSEPDAPAGDYTITYGAIPGYDTPATETQTLVSGGTITFTGTYTASVGTISVATNNAEATFTFTGPATYSGSGTTWTQNDAPIGTYTITYGEIPGYDTPATHSHTLNSGETITCTGTYTASVGTIVVNTNNADATFTLTGPATYSGSGTSWSQSNAPAGTYTITYVPISGYDTPPGEILALSSGGTITFTGTYRTVYIATLQVSDDTYIDEKYYNKNFGNSAIMHVRSKPNENKRSLIKFDTSSIPSGSRIVSATLKLDAKYIPKASRNYIINRALASWGESSVTWNNKPAVASSPTSSASTPPSPGWMEWDVTSDMQAFVNGNPNYGWQISDANENSPTEYKTEFHTSESSYTALRPLLVIQYAS